MSENSLPSAQRALSVLFVDDEPFAVQDFIDEMKEDGMDVDFFKSVKAGKDAFEAASYDLLVVDIMMPPGPYAKDSPDGMETGLHFLRDFRTKHAITPVIVLSNISSEDIKAEIGNVAFIVIVDKVKMLPLDFLKVVRAVVEGRPA
jgi:DNA-binding response OmpR family regulator